MSVRTILLAPGTMTSEQSESVWELLVAVDDEFVPSLSSRESTTTKNLTSRATSGGPIAYYRQILQQWTILASEGGGCVGFMSFIPHHREEALRDWIPCCYLSTLAVVHGGRRRGVAGRLYEALFASAEDLSDPYVATRTWSTNHSHLALLQSLGFTETARIVDHRGPGIDTVYLAYAVADRNAPRAPR